jgi:hypothetical protein
MENARQEFWGDLQVDLYTANSAIYLANQSLERILSTNGRKLHRPLFSHPNTGPYTPHSDINFSTKTATDQYLEVATFEYAAEDIDDTEKKQSPYDALQHSLTSIRKGMMNRVEQKFLSEISNAGQSIQAGVAQAVSGSNILDILEEAEGKLGAFDAPFETSMRAIVMGPRTVAKLRRAKSDRESRLGDSVLENGVVGPWQGWTVVQNNNLPWSATLVLATQPTAGDYIVVSGVYLEFQTDLNSTTAGRVGVLIGNNVAATRANLVACLSDAGTAGTNYVQMGIRDNFMIRRKRYVRATSAESMAFTGFGDISVSASFTSANNYWTAQQQKSVFMVRGAIDLVLQFMELEIGRKEKGFADLPKGLIGIGAKTFYDGADMMVQLVQDASDF